MNTLNCAEDFYSILGVTSNASQREIRTAYLTLASECHPDRKHSQANASIYAVNAAYAVLGDPDRRARYDAERILHGVATQQKGKNEMTETTSRNTERRGNLIPMPSVPQTYNQLGILVSDGSPSMEGESLDGMTKADCVDQTIRELFTRFKVSSQRKNLSLGLVEFASQGRMRLAPTNAADLDDNASYNPTRSGGQGTFIGSGLLVAQQMAEEFLAEARRETPSSTIIVVLSDGRDQESTGTGPEETLAIADEIKRNPAITICSCYFAEKGAADPEAQDTLRRIASNPATGFKTIYDAETLRNFFIASLSAGRKI